jgi:outer membrane biosynthesis protein TonB
VRLGLIGAILLHIVIFGLVIFNFSGRDSDAPQPSVPVSVEIMAQKDYSERQAGKADGKAEKPIAPAEVKAPEAAASAKKEVAEQKPSPKAAEKEALAPPPAPAPPAPAPKPVEVAKAEPVPEKPAEKPAPKPAVKKEPLPKPAARPKPEPAKKADEPQPKHAEARPEPVFDPSRISASLHKDETKSWQPRAAQSTMAAPPPKVYSERQTAVLNRDPNAGAPSGDYDPSKPWRPASSLQEQAMGVTGAHGAMNAGSCADAVQSRIEQNWILPIGGEAAETTIIRLHIELKRDGYLSRAPAVMDPAYSPVQQAMADAAVRAAESGQPYNIPPQQYEQCRDMILRFNPRNMYGG